MRVPVIKQPLTPWQQDQTGETLQTTSLINSNTLPLSDTVQIQVMKSVWQKWKLGGPHYQTFRKLEKTNKTTSLFSLKCFLPGRSSFSFHLCCISHIYVHFLPARQHIQHTPRIVPHVHLLKAWPGFSFLDRGFNVVPLIFPSFSWAWVFQILCSSNYSSKRLQNLKCFYSPKTWQGMCKLSVLLFHLLHTLFSLSLPLASTKPKSASFPLSHSVPNFPGSNP